MSKLLSSPNMHPAACIGGCRSLGQLGVVTSLSVTGLPPALQLASHLSVCKLLHQEWGFSMTRHGEAKISLPAHCCKTVRNKQDKDRDRPAVHTKALLDGQPLSPQRLQRLRTKLHPISYS